VSEIRSSIVDTATELTKLLTEKVYLLHINE